MKFLRTPEQTGFATSLRELLAKGDSVAAARAWADGDHEPGLKQWARLAEQGVAALLVPEDRDGLGGTPVDLVVAFEELGSGLAVGPLIESAVVLPTLMQGRQPSDDVAAGALGTVAWPPHAPYAVDADAADYVVLIRDGAAWTASYGDPRRSVDTTRHLFTVEPLEEMSPVSEPDQAFDLAALATSAQMLGCGERLLADTVAYAGQRKQFGRAIGSYQAVKHHLADVRIALDFARPLVEGAAVEPTARSTSAAKVAAGDAAYLAARTALQVHGAIGYTAELDLSLWINRVRALVGAWGTPAYHRARVIRSLSSERSERVEGLR